MEYYINILEGLKCYTAEFNAEIECIIFTNKAEYYIHTDDKKKNKIAHQLLQRYRLHSEISYTIQKNTVHT